MIAHLTFGKPIKWEHGLLEIEMVEVDTEHPPIMEDATEWRRVIEGSESFIRTAVTRLTYTYPGVVRSLSIFEDDGTEVAREWA